MNRGLAAAMLSSLALGGCAYNVAATSSPALSYYSVNQSKVPGRWALIVENDALNKTVGSSELTCSAHKWPMDVRETFKTSAQLTLANVFEEVVPRSSAPTAESLAAESFRGVVVMRVDSFEPRLKWRMGFWSSSPEATVTIAGGVRVYGPNGNLASFGLDAQRTGEAGGTGGCGVGSSALANAYEAAAKEYMSRTAERLADAPALRNNAR